METDKLPVRREHPNRIPGSILRDMRNRKTSFGNRTAVGNW